MLISIFGDQHWGARAGSKVFNDYFLKSFNEFYLPHMKSMGIDTILQLGDLFDVRKNTANFILKEVKDKYFDILRDEGFQFHTIAGNHDLYWKDSLNIVTQNLVLKEYNNVHVYTKPTTLNFGNASIDIIPWICAENYEEVMKFVKNSKSDINAGHYEFSGFAMYKGQEAHDGLDASLFKRYEKVWSGHYHTRSEKDNILYTGTPHEITWQDFNDPKGYHIFDTETREMTFYENPITIFTRLEWDDRLDTKYDFTEYTGKFVRLVVIKKTDMIKFDLFLQKLYECNPIEVKIIEDLSEFKTSYIDEDIDLEDSETILENYINNMDIELDKTKLFNHLKLLYTEAVNLAV